jgi:hypothetical protein
VVVPDTVAVKEDEAPVARVRAVGLRATLTVGEGAWTVATAAALLLGSALLVAVMVWLPVVVGAV